MFLSGTVAIDWSRLQATQQVIYVALIGLGVPVHESHLLIVRDSRIPEDPDESHLGRESSSSSSPRDGDDRANQMFEMNKLRYSPLDQLWIPSVLASAGAFTWIYLLPSLAVGTPLKFVLGSLGSAFAYVPIGLVALGILMGFMGIALSRPRLPAIIATIAGLATALAVLFPYFVGGD